jgi:HD-like signal output (HDOD) protein
MNPDPEVHQRTPKQEESNQPPEGLAGWVQRLSECGMPVFARTAQDIGKVTSSRDSTASELAQTVLQDPALTARLLRVANSPLFNATGRPISTVTRAVVLLGFDEVRTLCLSIAVVESMLRGSQKDRMLVDMARSFHAAVQARCFAERRGDPAPEEVFIATLLYRLGDMAFWAHAGAQAAELERSLLEQPEADSAQVQRDLLGFSLSDLTLCLSREWRLGELLENALAGRRDQDPRCSNVVLGHQLAAAAERGWDHIEVGPLLERLAETLYLSVEDLTALVHRNAEEAARTAGHYGAAKAAARIPRVTAKGGEARLRSEDKGREAPFLAPDTALQLQILRELSLLLESNPNINNILELVLEGVYRGVGMDRTLFALLSPDQRFLKARYILGHERDLLRQRFHFRCDPLKANLFTHVLESRAAFWLRAPMEAGLRPLMTKQVRDIGVERGFFAMPIEIQGRVIGLFYADRKTSGRTLDEESYGGFRHFCQEGNMALNFVSARR